MYRIALILEIPQKNAPDYYMKMDQEIANSTLLFDRDDELLVLNNSLECDKMQLLLEQYSLTIEKLELIFLPKEAQLFSLFTDYGFTSKTGHDYLPFGPGGASIERCKGSLFANQPKCLF